MRLVVTLERDETGMLVAECPAIPGCVSQRRTEGSHVVLLKAGHIASLSVPQHPELAPGR